MRCWFPLILFLILSAKSGAQPQYRFYSSPDGLPSNQIYNLYLDKKGYLWMGHSLGLTRFDGNRFSNFTTPLQNSLGMSNILEDKYGTLWCHNFGGQIFYLKNNVLRVFEKYTWRNQQTFPAITITKGETLIATHPLGLYVHNITTGKDTIIAPEGERTQPRNFGLGKVNDVAYAIFSGIMYKVQGESLVKMKFRNGESIASKTSIIILGSFRDSLYTLTADRKTIHVIHIQDSTYTFSRSLPAIEGAFIVTSPNDHEAWVFGRSVGVDLLNPQNRIENFNLTGIKYDAEGNTWISTLQNGLGKITAAPRTVKTVYFSSYKTEIINSLKVWGNSLAVSTNRSFIYFLDENYRVFMQKSEPFGTPFGIMKIGPDNKLLLGSNHLYELNDIHSTLRTISDNSSVKDISYDTAGNYYVANAYRLDRVDSTGSVHFLRNKRCFSVDGIAEKGKFYAAFNDGVFSFNKNSVLAELKANNRSLFSPSLTVFDDQIVVGTISDGVYFFKNDSLTRHLNKFNGLLSNHILKVKYIDRKIWILTDVSLVEYSSSDGSMYHHTFGDEIALSNISDFAMWNGLLYMSMGNQIKIYDPEGIKVIQIPKVFIDHFIINGKDTLLNPNPQLRHDQNQVRFIISGISYSSGKNLGFEYILAGHEPFWHKVPSSNYIIDYPALPPGNFTFKVRAISAEGVPGETIDTAFTISKPWWQQLWFIMLSLFSTAYVVNYFVSTRVKRIRKRNELELEKINLQSRWRDSMLATIRSQMNPHFIFNALNTIQSYIYSKDENKASTYLGKFSDLVRRILDYSQKQQITLANEIEMLQLYVDLEVLRFENTLKTEIFVDPNLSLDTFYIPPMLVQPYVENAIKHGLLHKPDNRDLKIRFEQDASQTTLIITVEDNGIGRHASREINKHKKHGHKSFSTMANQKRLEMLNMNFLQKISIDIQDKKDQHNQPAGTIVVIKVPFSINFG